MNNQADTQYNRIIHNIVKNGVWDIGENIRPKWEDGESAYSKSVIGQSMIFDNTEIPILTTKEVKWKSAIKELLWIWQMKSNRVQDLRDMGVNIWDKWERKDGTIGKAYGYQLGKTTRFYPKHKVNFDLIDNSNFINDDFHVHLDQVDYLINELINNPQSRRHITTLWSIDDLDDMSLLPCVYETQWYVRNGELHLQVRSRSNDMGLGNPFNIFQYNILQRMIAQVTGYKLGTYRYDIGDAHIYDRHMKSVVGQMKNEFKKPPKLWINPNIKSFYDFTIDDFKLIDYECGEFIPLEIAI